MSMLSQIVYIVEHKEGEEGSGKNICMKSSGHQSTDDSHEDSSSESSSSSDENASRNEGMFSQHVILTLFKFLLTLYF